MDRQPSAPAGEHDWNEGPAAHPMARANRMGPRALLNWWWRVTAPVEPAASASFALRERARRGRLLSVLLLCFLLVEVGALWQYVIVDSDHPSMVAVLLLALPVALLAGMLNRLGRVTAAGILLIGLADLLPLAGVHATAPRLDILELGVFYLLVGSELVAASVLAPWSVYIVALVNSVLALGSIVLSPQAPALQQFLQRNDAQQVYAGPVLMQLVVAIVAYLWAQSTSMALRRADRAEEIAALERRELDRTRELEEGVRELLAVHVQLANGNFAARVPPVRNRLLWQIGASLNNLTGRLSRLAHADFGLQRTAAEAHRLAEAIRSMRAGRQPVWPAPTGTPLDEVIAALSDNGPAPSLAPPADRIVGAPPAPQPDMRSDSYTYAPAQDQPGTPPRQPAAYSSLTWLFAQPQPQPQPGPQPRQPGPWDPDDGSPRPG